MLTISMMPSMATEISMPTTKDLQSGMNKTQDTNLMSEMFTPKEYVELISRWDAGRADKLEILKESIKNPDGWITQSWLKAKRNGGDLNNIFMIVESDRLIKEFKSGDFYSIIELKELAKVSKYADTQLKNTVKSHPTTYNIATKIENNYNEANFNIYRYNKSEIGFDELIVLSEKNDFIRSALRSTIPGSLPIPKKSKIQKRKRIVIIEN